MSSTLQSACSGPLVPAIALPAGLTTGGARGGVVQKLVVTPRASTPPASARGSVAPTSTGSISRASSRSLQRVDTEAIVGSFSRASSRSLQRVDTEATQLSQGSLGYLSGSIRSEGLRSEPTLNEWEILIQMDKAPLGISLEIIGQHALAMLAVKSVHKDGAIPTWNAAHAGKAVCEGDFFVAVNGLRGEPVALLDAMKAGGAMQVLVRRPLLC